MTHADSPNNRLTRDTSSGISKLESLGWTSLIVLIVLAEIWFRGARITNDSFQYLSTAENIASGQGIATSLIYFDEQRVTTRIPAPQTVFPCGYPALVALPIALGMDPELAGLIVSGGSNIASLLILTYILKIASIARFYIRCIVIYFIVNNEIILLSRSILSESMFSMISLVGLGLLVAADRRAEDDQVGLVQRVAGSAIVGLACCVRYAGIFLLAGLLLVYGFRWACKRDRLSLIRLISATSGTPVVLGLLARNYWLSGIPLGGNAKPVNRPWLDVAGQLTDSIRDILLGHGSIRIGTIGPALASGVLVASLLLMGLGGWLAIQRARHGAGNQGCPADSDQMLLLCSWAIAYMLGLAYAGKSSVVSFADTRMVYPILPALGIIAGKLGNILEKSAGSMTSRVMRGGVVVMVGSLVGLHVRGLWYPVSRPDSTRAVRIAVQEPIADAPSLGAWLAAHSPTGHPILAGDGQALGYLTHRSIVGLGTSHYSRTSWSESAVRDLATRYEAYFLVLLTNGTETRELRHDSAFLRQVDLAVHLPDWISLIACNEHVRIYRLKPSSR